MQKIWKELDEFNGDYGGMAAQKPHSDHSDKKRTPKFVGEIQAIIDNDPSESIKSVAKNMEMSKFLIRHIVPENIHCFSYKTRKNQFLSQAMKDKRKELSNFLVISKPWLTIPESQLGP